MHIKKATVKDIQLLAELFDQYRVFYEKESDVDGAIRFLTERVKFYF